MSTGNRIKGRGVETPARRFGIHRSVALLLTALAIVTAACQQAPAATEQWIPSYLELNLYSGSARLQWPGESEWTEMDGKANITIHEGGRISAGAAEGAKFFLGDGSTLELGPETTIEVQNPRTFPRLQMSVESGSILFFAQKPSYEFALSVCPVKLLSVPSLITVEVISDTTRLAVEEGAVTCEMETETLTLPTCRQMVIRPGEEPDVTDFCTPSTVVAPPTATASPSPTPPGFVPTATSTPSATPTPTSSGTVIPTPTGRGVPVAPTHTPVPPTAEPPKPKKTKPPPTQPPPPPPTTKPTEPPPPPTAKPTEAPRPTQPPAPTAEPVKPTPEPPKPTAESPRPTAEST